MILSTTQNRFESLFKSSPIGQNAIVTALSSVFVLFSMLTMGPLSQARSININPVSMPLNNSYFNLEDASLADRPFSGKRTRGRIMSHINYHWSHHPWILLSQDGQKEIEPLVDSLQTLDLGVSWLLSSEDLLGFQTSGSYVAVAPAYGGEKTVHLGDSRIIYKRRLLTTTFWSFAIASELTLPTGVDYLGHMNGASLSNSSVAPGSKLIAEYKTTENQWVFNAGFAYYSQAEIKAPASNYPQIDGRTRLLLGAGWLTRISKQWALDTEWNYNPVMGVNHFTPAGILTLGARYQQPRALSWKFGLGTGSLGGAGGNDPLLYAGLNIPLMGSVKRSQDLDQPRMEKNNENNGDSDILLEEAYKNRRERISEDGLAENSTSGNGAAENEASFSDLSPSGDAESASYNPVDEETGKPLFTGDDLTKQSDLEK